MYVAVDDVCDKLETQVRRHKEKVNGITGRRRRRTRIGRSTTTTEYRAVLMHKILVEKLLDESSSSSSSRRMTGCTNGMIPLR